MARRATSKTKARPARQKAAPDPVMAEIPVDVPRRGRKPKPRDVEPPDPSPADAVVPSGDGTASEPGMAYDGDTAAPDVPTGHGPSAGDGEPGNGTADQEADAVTDVPPVKARRGRPPKVRTAPESGAPPESTLPPVTAGNEGPGPAGAAAELTPVKSRRGRPPKTPPVANPPAATETAVAGRPVTGPPPASGASAARWDPVAGTASFDWPTIEQVAATEGPNQAMARLLLAARAEGANSRWPF